MNELDLINVIAGIVKRCIDNNSNFNEWEKAVR